MDAITTICEEEELPIVLMPNIPRLKFHDDPFYFMSEPGITQQEYQKRVCARGSNSPETDDSITVKCPDRDDGAGRNFQFQRSVLKRSPTLAKFFESPYYLPGCEMRLTFVVDPAVCLEIAYKYLEEGPDIFQQTILRVQLTMRYKLVDRLIILVRLHSLAKKLALPGLMDMAFGVLSEGGPQIRAPECITLSSLIFAKTANFDRKLKEWCIDHVTRYLPQLEHSQLWQKVLWKADLELAHRWKQLLDTKGSRLGTVDEGAEDSEMNTIMANKKYVGLQVPSPHSASTAASKEQSFQDILDEVAQGKVKPELTDEEWDITEALCASSPHNGNQDKLVRFFGDENVPSASDLRREGSFSQGLSPSPSSLFSPGLDKAQFVIGWPGMPDRGDRNMRSSFSSSTPLPTPTRRKTGLLAGF
ncbi:MAG: hypothetical protein LQ343_002009 [Gyalolechia ehrenbergii]|nr:MAG: hypothetical protein LQ343_002009 [Gyalolechia ehrenbergii]